MKNYFLLLSLFLLCCCNPETITSDASVEYEFRVINRSERVVVISSDDPDVESVTLAKGDRKVICQFLSLGTVSNKKPMRDPMKENHYIGEYLRYPFTMTADGENVSDDIWLRRYWSFESGLHSLTYTLIVTDRLLERLAEEEE